MLQACLSWLGGGSFHHIRVITGVSKSSFYRIIYRVMRAIHEADELKLRFPATSEKKKQMSEGFATRSTGGILQGCIGAMDGWLCSVRVPRKRECGRVDSFFSGHYQEYGLNVQACVDYNSRFTAVAVSCPGGMNDSMAFQRWEMSELLRMITDLFYVVGDNAYTQTRTVMTPYNKTELAGRKDRDKYNFFISQLRIRVEMAFGLLVNKWRILKSPLLVRLKMCYLVIVTCMKLHNFTVDAASIDGTVSMPSLLRQVRVENGDDDISYAESNAPLDEPPSEDTPAAATSESVQVHHYILGEAARELLVRHIASHNMQRPAQNIARRVREISVSHVGLFAWRFVWYCWQYQGCEWRCFEWRVKRYDQPLKRISLGSVASGSFMTTSGSGASGSVEAQRRALSHFALRPSVHVALVSTRLGCSRGRLAMPVYGADSIIILDIDWRSTSDAKLRANWAKRLVGKPTEFSMYRFHCDAPTTNNGFDDLKPLRTSFDAIINCMKRKTPPPPQQRHRLSMCPRHLRRDTRVRRS